MFWDCCGSSELLRQCLNLGSQIQTLRKGLVCRESLGRRPQKHSEVGESEAGKAGQPLKPMSMTHCGASDALWRTCLRVTHRHLAHGMGHLSTHSGAPLKS